MWFIKLLWAVPLFTRGRHSKWIGTFDFVMFLDQMTFQLSPEIWVPSWSWTRIFCGLAEGVNPYTMEPQIVMLYHRRKCSDAWLCVRAELWESCDLPACDCHTTCCRYPFKRKLSSLPELVVKGTHPPAELFVTFKVIVIKRVNFFSLQHFLSPDFFQIEVDINSLLNSNQFSLI